MTVLWTAAQLVFWLTLMALVVAGAIAAVLAPPYLVYRLIRH